MKEIIDTNKGIIGLTVTGIIGLLCSAAIDKGANVALNLGNYGSVTFSKTNVNVKAEKLENANVHDEECPVSSEENSY